MTKKAPKCYPTIKLTAIRGHNDKPYEWRTPRYSEAWACHEFFDRYFELPDFMDVLWVTAYVRPAKDRLAVRVEFDPCDFPDEADAGEWVGYYIMADEGRDRFYLAYGPNWMKKVVGKTIYVGVEYA